MIFAPASVTFLFSPNVTEDPLRSGSMGVSVALDLGVRVKVERGEKTEIIVNGERWDFPTVREVSRSLGFTGRIEIEMDLPAGCGFGMSGASALATALAINEKLSLNRSLFELADVAHMAEVVSRTGLGDVTTQCHGGFVVRKNAMCPSKCIVDKYLWNASFEVEIIGELRTDELLSLSLERIAHLGRKKLLEFLKKPTLENLFKQAKDFAMESGFMDDKIADLVEYVESLGGMATMVMLGRSVIAFGANAGFHIKCKPNFCGAMPIG